MSTWFNLQQIPFSAVPEQKKKIGVPGGDLVASLMQDTPAKAQSVQFPMRDPSVPIPQVKPTAPQAQAVPQEKAPEESPYMQMGEQALTPQQEIEQLYLKGIRDNQDETQAVQKDLGNLKEPNWFQKLDLRGAANIIDQFQGTNFAGGLQENTAQKEFETKQALLKKALEDKKTQGTKSQLDYLKMLDERKKNEELLKYKEQMAHLRGEKGDRGAELGLADKWNSDPTTKRSKVVSEGLSKIESAYHSNDPADYMTMIYGLMKMQDPDSAVREAEFKTGEGIGGWPAKWQVMFKKAKGDITGPITQVQKDSIMRQAAQIWEAQQAEQTQADQWYRSRAQHYGFQPEMVVGSQIRDRRPVKMNGSKPQSKLPPTVPKLKDFNG